MGWAIFITNVDHQTWSIRQIMKAYGFRWRIESIFKCWKSHFNINKLSTKGRVSKEMAQVFIFYMLALITLVWVKLYLHWSEKIYTETGRYLSVNRFIDFIKAIRNVDLQDQDEQFLFQMILKFATYEKRKDRINFQQAMTENRSTINYFYLVELG